MSETTVSKHPVIDTPVAGPADALAHFRAILSYETDCWSVHASIAAGYSDFVLLDVRGPDLYNAGHIETAINLPYRRIIERNLAQFPSDALFVVYCSGPHCGAADRAAASLAALGRKVKKMIGGIAGWKDDGFDLVAESEPKDNH